MEAVEIVESRAKVLLLLAGSLAFVAVYAFVPDPDHHLPIWGLWFFGLCAAVFVALLLRPRRLRLDSQGVSVSGGLARKSMKLRWDEVTGFFPIRAGTAMVGFNYSADCKSKPGGTALSKSLSGADGAIAGAWPCSTLVLAQRLNDYRERALAPRFGRLALGKRLD